MSRAASSRSSFETRLSELRELSEEIYASRPDLQKAFPDPHGTPYWQWLQTHGCGEYDRVRELSMAVPPPEIMRVVHFGDATAFLHNGASAYGLLDRVLKGCGRALAASGPILEFGCGPGRVLRMMFRHADDLRVVGTDVDAAAIDWCRSNFPFGEFHVNDKNPPTNLPSSTFGLIYAISVFSHLAEQPHVGWLRELRRLSRRDGVLILTVCGRHTLRRGLADERWRQVLGVTAEELAEVNGAVESRGFAFVRQPEGHLDRDQYGITFLTEDYVRREWSKEFDVVAHEEAALDEWQDVVVLRSRG
jgi:SAM-dependent methyltransferase